jgi:hypothetical protein
MLTKEPRRVAFSKTTFGDAHHQRFVVILWSVQVDAIYGKEYERCDSPDSLVAINEGVIPNDMEKVGGSHRKQVFVEVVVACASRWHGKC